MECEVHQSGWDYLSHWSVSHRQLSRHGPWSGHPVFWLWLCPWEHTLWLYPPSKVTKTHLEAFSIIWNMLSFPPFSFSALTYFHFFFHHCKLSPQNCVDLVLIWGICSKTWNYVSASSKGPHHSVPLTYWDMPTTAWLSQPWKLTHLVVVCEFLWITGFQTLVYEQHVYGSVRLIFWEEKTSWSVLHLCKIDLCNA